MATFQNSTKAAFLTLTLLSVFGCAGPLKITRPFDSTDMKYLNNSAESASSDSKFDIDDAESELRRS